MNAGGAFGGSRGVKPIPPEKGVFPLDHLHQCDIEKTAYMDCLKSKSFKSEKCRELSKKYLQCRMERNLMAKQNIEELGFLEADNATKKEAHLHRDKYNDAKDETIQG